MTNARRCHRCNRAEIQEFSSTVHSVVENLSSQAAVIENAKLKVCHAHLARFKSVQTAHNRATRNPRTLQAIGQRIIVEGERESRKRKQRELQALIDERAAELARLQAEHDSLSRIEAEQRELITKLESHEPSGI